MITVKDIKLDIYFRIWSLFLVYHTNKPCPGYLFILSVFDRCPLVFFRGGECRGRSDRGWRWGGGWWWRRWHADRVHRSTPPYVRTPHQGEGQTYTQGQLTLPLLPYQQVNYHFMVTQQQLYCAVSGYPTDILYKDFLNMVCITNSSRWQNFCIMSSCLVKQWSFIGTNHQDHDTLTCNEFIHTLDVRIKLIFATFRFRVLCHKICNHSYFGNIVLACILISSAMLAAEDPLNANSDRNQVGNTIRLAILLLSVTLIWTEVKVVNNTLPHVSHLFSKLFIS